MSIFKELALNEMNSKLTDEYLSYRYGDWQTPVKVVTKDDRALKEVNSAFH
jgi:hypothetical protein